MINRSSGVLMHISSIPSDYGIGTMGKEAYNFVDFIKNSGQTYWQFLPICPPNVADSPYQSYSTFAGNPYFIDLDLLEQNGYLSKSDYVNINWGKDNGAVDYDKIHANRLNILRIAYKNWIKTNKLKLEKFIEKYEWTDNYSLFMTLLDANHGKTWWDWEDKFKFRDKVALKEFKSENEDEINFWIFTQCVFFEQWFELKKYANDKGIKFIGDLPIYVSGNSSDSWANAEDFCLDETMHPIQVSGCPPDAFSKSGQLWGNPIFNWDKMKEENYEWWYKRFKAYTEIFDVIRIDHFRAFDSYYSIDANEKTAVNGKWVNGPGYEFFEVMKKRLGEFDIIAEDLGYLTQSVRDLVKKCGFPGMKILEFAFDSREESDYLPHNYNSNSVVYVGTHDNNTAIGWSREVDAETRIFCKKYLNIGLFEGFNWGMIRGSMSSVSNLSITQMQDFLGLGAKARMNIPSTVGINWKWRMKKGAATEKLAKKIYNMTELYGRVPRNKTNK